MLPLSEAVEHPQVKARGLVVEVPREDLPAQPQLACPLKFSDGLPSPRHVGTAVGAHTEQVLVELGYDAERIAALREARVFG